MAGSWQTFLTKLEILYVKQKLNQKKRENTGFILIEYRHKVMNTPADILLDSPDVDYACYEEFNILLTHVRISYAEMIDTSVQRQMMHRQNLSPLYWSEYDMLMMGLGEFQEMIDKGHQTLMILTKNKGQHWCKLFNHELVVSITTASRTYVSTVMSMGVTPPYMQLNVHIPTMIEMMKTVLYEHLAISNQASYPGKWIQDLYHHHFKEVFFTSGIPRLIVRQQDWKQFEIVILKIFDHFQLPEDLSKKIYLSLTNKLYST